MKIKYHQTARWKMPSNPARVANPGRVRHETKPGEYHHLTVTNREPLDFKCYFWRGCATVRLPRSRIRFVSFCSINVETLRVYGFGNVFVGL
jgi:hypothetical protein